MPAAPALDTVDFHLNEALTNLYVGLHRELRGERLSAMRFIQVYAIDRVLALVRLDPTTVWTEPDPFEPTRRVERTVGERILPLEQIILGYTGNAASAVATLQWLRERYDLAPAIHDAIEGLILTATSR